MISFIECKSKLNFTVQPPQELNCNPTGLTVALYCRTSPSGSFHWYHTLDSTQAGKTGNSIVNDGKPYTIDSNFHGPNSGLSFKVSNSTVGFYWCVITTSNSVSLRPSTVTPICSFYNNSLPSCPLSFSLDNQHHYDVECADANITYHRELFPTDCILQPSSSSTFPVSTTPHYVRTTKSVLSVSSFSTNTTILTPLISSSSNTLTTLIPSSSIAIQTSTVLTMFTPIPTITEPTLNIGPSPTPSSQNLLLLYTLIGICILLAIIALIIVIAIIILCCMTRRQHSLEAATPKGTTNYV